MNGGGPTALERFIRGVLPENPVYRQVLGMCPTLAVTNGMKSGMTMAGAVLFVLLCSNVIISLIRGVLRPHLRILVFTLTIATFVTVADRVLAAYMYDMSRQLGPYIPLIIVNCVIICRCEVCASQQSIGRAVGDAFGQGLGFALALASICTVREVLGNGTWFDIPLGWHDADQYKWIIMVLPPGAFITLGVLMGLVNWFSEARENRQAKAKEARALQPVEAR